MFVICFFKKTAKCPIGFHLSIKEVLLGEVVRFHNIEIRQDAGIENLFGFITFRGVFLYEKKHVTV